MKHIAIIGAAMVALTAALGCSKQPPSDLPVTEPAARAKALEKVPGKVVHHELDQENDRWVHSFEIEPSAEPQAKKEVDVDARSGEVVEIENE